MDRAGFKEEEETFSNSENYDSDFRGDRVLNDLITAAQILKILADNKDDINATPNFQKKTKSASDDSDDLSGTYVISEDHSPSEDVDQSRQTTERYEHYESVFPHIATFLNTIQRKYSKYVHSERSFEAFWVDCRDLSVSGDIEVKQQYDLASREPSASERFGEDDSVRWDDESILDVMEVNNTDTWKEDDRYLIMKMYAINVIDEIFRDATMLVEIAQRTKHFNIPKKVINFHINNLFSSRLSTSSGMNKKCYSLPTSPYKRYSIVRSIGASDSGDDVEAERAAAVTEHRRTADIENYSKISSSEVGDAGEAAVGAAAGPGDPGAARRDGPRALRTEPRARTDARTQLPRGPTHAHIMTTVRLPDGDRDLSENVKKIGEVINFKNGLAFEANTSEFLSEGLLRRNKMNGDSAVSGGLPDLIDEKENCKFYDSSEKLSQFESAIGGEKFKGGRAPARKFVGKWRDARRRSMRRRALRGGGPRRCVLPRVVPAGPLLPPAPPAPPTLPAESPPSSLAPRDERHSGELNSPLNSSNYQLPKVPRVWAVAEAAPARGSHAAQRGAAPAAPVRSAGPPPERETSARVPSSPLDSANCVCSCHSIESASGKTKGSYTNRAPGKTFKNLESDFSESEVLLDSNEFNEINDSLDFLSSKVLNSFEISSRLKRLEEKLKNSVDALKESDSEEIESKFVPDSRSEGKGSNLPEAECEADRAEENPDEEDFYFFDKHSTSTWKNNYLDSYCRANRELNISEFCTESLNADDAAECPTKKLYSRGKLSAEEAIGETLDKPEVRGDDLCSDEETRELEEFERQERWASNEEYFKANADVFAGSSCQFTASDVSKFEVDGAASEERLRCYDELWDSSESISSVDEETAANTLANGNMKGEQPARPDRRHNKDANNLKSLLKKASRKGKKNRVIFNENRNEFFEADYIILIREECQYDEESDEGVCTCSQHEMVRLRCGQEEGEPTLSPPEGYKDPGLFRPDGSLREQGLLAGPGGLLVAEAGGPVFSPQHLRQLQLIQRLQQEQLRRARQALQGKDANQINHNDIRIPEDRNEVEPTPEVEEKEDKVEQENPPDEEDRLSSRSYAKEIVAGEERPKVNSGQQTTPTDEVQRYVVETVSMTTETERTIIREAPAMNKDDPSEGGQSETPGDMHSSPMRLGGILKGGRLWKASMDMPQPSEQTEESTSFSNSASDEEGRGGRAVRFSEPNAVQGDSLSQVSSVDELSESQDRPDSPAKPQELTLTFKLGNHLLSNNSLRPNSAVRQLFPAGPHFVSPPQRTDADKQYLVTAESLRAFEEGKRSKLPTSYRDEDLTVRRTIDRNTLRRSLVKVEPRKKTPQKNDTSLTERIKMLTCNIEDEDGAEEQKTTNVERGSSTEETHTPVQLPSKCFSPSSSSSSASSCSSTSSTYKKLTDIFPKRQDRIPECNEEGTGVVIIPQADKLTCLGGGRPGDRLSLGSASTEYSSGDIEGVLDQPAPDVLAGTPGAGEGDELARFVQQEAARTERLRKRYTQQASADNSDEDDQDDYGFQRRPSVRGIKPRFGSTNEILQQMQNQLMAQAQTRPGHISWPYYSESNLSLPAPHDHMLHHATDNRPMEEFQQQPMRRERERADQGVREREMHPAQHHLGDPHHENIYQNCLTYANVRCNDGERDMYAGNHMHAYSRAHRRPESPPPIRSYHQTMVLIPYSNLQPHYSNTERSYHMGHPIPGEQNGAHLDYQHQHQVPKEPLPHLKHNQNPQQMVTMPYQQTGIPMQITCSAPIAHLRTVPARPVARHMICYSEKVQPPLYQAAPESAEVAGDNANIPIYF